MALGKYQVRVRLRDRQVHSSGTADAKVALDRAYAQALKAGLGAIARVDEVLTQKANKIVTSRVAYEGRVTNGETGHALVAEDHHTPPPSTPPTPEHHV